MTDTIAIDHKVIQRFSRLMASGRLAHAYLLVGPKQAGKTQTARALAQLVNCENSALEACGECPSCRKIASGNHPDVHVIGNVEMESIKIDDIRFLLSRAQLRPYEAKCKVFIIRNIELMTPDAANALLKTLEEPAANTLMILTTSVPEDSLATIRSRCHIVKLFRKEDNIPFDRKVINEMLFNRNNDTFLKEIASEPQESVGALRLLLSFFRDVLLLKCGVPKTALTYQECSKEMEKFAAKGFEELELIIRQIVKTKKLVDDKLNIRMSLSLLREYIWAN
jgi:DNA polymerase III delta' subunit